VLNDCPDSSPRCDSSLQQVFLSVISVCDSPRFFPVQVSVRQLPPSLRELPALDAVWAPRCLGLGCRLSPGSGLSLCQGCPGRHWLLLQRLPPDGSRCSEKRNSTLTLEHLFPGKLEVSSQELPYQVMVRKQDFHHHCSVGFLIVEEKRPVRSGTTCSYNTASLWLSLVFICFAKISFSCQNFPAASSSFPVMTLHCAPFGFTWHCRVVTILFCFACST